eukprot:15032389-Heterocapsa_arctica.AAC.1
MASCQSAVRSSNLAKTLLGVCRQRPEAQAVEAHHLGPADVHAHERHASDYARRRHLAGGVRD